MNTLTEATKLGLETKLAKVEDRACHGDSRNAAICMGRDRAQATTFTTDRVQQNLATRVLEALGHRPSYERLPIGIPPEELL
jgi:hypothetical protein